LNTIERQVLKVAEQQQQWTHCRVHDGHLDLKTRDELCSKQQEAKVIWQRLHKCTTLVEPCDRLTDGWTDIANIGNNFMHAMMQPKIYCETFDDKSRPNERYHIIENLQDVYYQRQYQ